MLADRDAGAEQPRMHRPRADARVVDVVAVDPDQRRAIRDQPVGGLAGQKRVIVDVGVGPPVPVPAGVDQHRLAAHVEAVECRCFDREPVFERPPHDDRRADRRATASGSSREIGAVGVAVERAST